VPRVALTTLGCKVNQYETQRIADSFEALGFEVVPFDDEAEVYVVNTCSVTTWADAKSRYMLRRAARRNPAAVRVVTGCAAQAALNRGEGLAEADLVVPNPSKLETASRFAATFPRLADSARSQPAAAPSAPSRTRATLKVQDGCSVRCSYCSIPDTRPVLMSRPYHEVLEEAASLAASGVREAVLTGVLIGDYGPESGSGGPSFEALVERLREESGLERVRISSIELPHVSQRLLEAVAAGHAVPHLHIPLQSGDDAVLASMGRRYRAEDYLRCVEHAYRTVADLSLTTDVMVGFPTEDETRFLSTLSVCEEARFLKSHVFRFSPREGTEAEALGDPVPPEAKAVRARRVQAVAEQTGAAHVGRFLGRTMEVLVEGGKPDGGLAEGRTANGIVVRFVGSKSWQGRLVPVRLEKAFAWGAEGEAAGGPVPSLGKA
jgi:threonylcarbamoyladenosine tRNA methylthiotransferase MtaB